MKHNTSLQERIEFYTKKAGEDDCWSWNGTVDQHGYAQLRYKYKLYRVSRLIVFGLVSSDKLALHRCNNANCCNPKHLFAGTYQDNNVDALRDRLRSGVTAPKFDYETAQHIRQSKESTAELSRKFAVGYTVIRDIRKGKTYTKDHTSKEQV